MKPSRLARERWQRVDHVFDLVLDTSTEEREAILDQHCAGDESLRAEVLALLEAHEELGSRFDEPGAVLSVLDSEEVEADPSPTRIGPFRLLREIGRGGMGVVYLAEDTRLGRYVAVKALPQHLGSIPDAKSRFEREARAVSALDHPNIATLYELGESKDGRLYLVFAFYDGETLEARIRRGPLEISEALRIAVAIAEGLDAAHANGIIHRDVKPSNVLVAGSKAVKLLDFGVAKVAGEAVTGDGVRLGTAAYMSPEHARADPLDHRADLWSLGVVLYEMLTGARPFRGHDVISTLNSILHDEPEPAPSVRPAVPQALDKIVRKLLAKEPDSRYRTTGDLIADLKAVEKGEAPGVAIAEPPQPRTPRIRRLAVLPLANLTGDPERAHLVHGIHDAIVSELGRVRALEVISRTSVLRFRDTELPIPEIATELGVDAVVEGSVSVDGEGLAITTQLIAGVPERHIWADTYRRGVGNVLDVAAEVATSIAAELGITLTTSAESQLSAHRTVDPEAYEAFTLGLFHLDRRSPEGHEQALKYLQRAVAKDPEFAPAHAMLGEAYGSAAFFGLASPTETLPIARTLVDRALALDPRLAAAHTSLGAVRMFGEWDWAGAEASLRKAISINPSYAYAHLMLSDVLAVLGRYSEALEAAERNAELEQFVPFSAFHTVKVLNHSGEYSRAIDGARKALEFFTDFWQGHWLLALALIGTEQYDLALEECEKAAERSRRTPMALGALGLAHGLRGDEGAAETVLTELERRSDVTYVGPSNFAIVLGALGDHDQAFDYLERACEVRDMQMVHLVDDVSFASLRSDTRFEALLQRMGIEPRTTS